MNTSPTHSISAARVAATISSKSRGSSNNALATEESTLRGDAFCPRGVLINTGLLCYTEAFLWHLSHFRREHPDVTDHGPICWYDRVEGETWLTRGEMHLAFNKQESHDVFMKFWNNRSERLGFVDSDDMVFNQLPSSRTGVRGTYVHVGRCNNLREMYDWVFDNCIGKVYQFSDIFLIFEDENEASLFSLFLSKST